MQNTTGNNPVNNPQENLRQMELAISWILRIGVFVSAAFIVIGTILFIITGKSGYNSDLNSSSNAVGSYTSYQGEKNANLYFPTNPVDIASGAFALKSFGFISLGLFLLILTPIIRVAVSVFTFAYEKDWLYVLFTLFVLTILIASFLLGKAGG